jgi:hypothetical protein
MRMAQLLLTSWPNGDATKLSSMPPPVPIHWPFAHYSTEQRINQPQRNRPDHLKSTPRCA